MLINIDIITEKIGTNSFQDLKRSHRVSKLGVVTQTSHKNLGFTKITVIPIGTMQQLYNTYHHDSLQAIQKTNATI